MAGPAQGEEMNKINSHLGGTRIVTSTRLGLWGHLLFPGCTFLFNKSRLLSCTSHSWIFSGTEARTPWLLCQAESSLGRDPAATTPENRSEEESEGGREGKPCQMPFRLLRSLMTCAVNCLPTGQMRKEGCGSHPSLGQHGYGRWLPYMAQHVPIGLCRETPGEKAKGIDSDSSARS